MAAKLLRYADRDDYYVRHTFAKKGGGVINVTYQVTPGGLDRLKKKGVEEGAKIPQNLLKKLKGSGDLYTGGSGAGSGGDAIHRCPKCQGAFDSENALKRHLKQEHPVVRRRRCNHCRTTLLDRPNVLLRHLQEEHPEKFAKAIRSQFRQID